MQPLGNIALEQKNSEPVGRFAGTLRDPRARRKRERKSNGARGTSGVTRLGGTALAERFGRLDLSVYRRVIALAPPTTMPLASVPGALRDRDRREDAGLATLGLSTQP